MPEPRNIPALTSLRFFAAAAIFALHTTQFSGFPTSDFLGFTLPQGVAFFYVLSGFILHYNYRSRLQNINWASFFVLRFARIWPLHVVTLAGAAALAWSDMLSWYHGYLSPYSLASIILLLHAWSVNSAVYFAINGVSWSISVEMFFYASFIPLAFCIKRKPIITCLAYLCFLALYIIIVWETPSLRTLKDALLSINPFFRLIDFIVGILGAELLIRRKHRPDNSTLQMTCTELLVLAAVIFANFFNQTAVTIGILPLRTIAYTSLTDPFFIVMICIFAHSKGLVSRLLNYKALVVLGQWSFAIYLVHQPLQRFISVHLASYSPWTMTAFAIVATLVVSAACHYWVELPAYGLVKRLVAHKANRTAYAGA
ncbi:acyltransferase family protein [Pseudomonas sp. LB3P38]|uniref:acyltransferase family protein n=1 Tax=Pseudomonas lyxosi TaxID=3398358 RepID=UPI0039F12B42